MKKFFVWKPWLKLLEKKEVKILLNGNGDLRHALKTISDNCHDFGEIEVLEVGEFVPEF